MTVLDKEFTKIDYSLEPKDFFFIPGVDTGLYALSPIRWYWRQVDRGKVSGFAVSKFDDHNRRVNDIIESYTKRRAFSSAIEFNSILVILEDFKVVGNSVSCCEKWIISSSSGARVKNRYLWNHSPNIYENEAKMLSYFEAIQPQNNNATIPIFDGLIDGLPFVIEARNLHNYYHFLTETLPRIQTAIDIGHQGPIIIAHKNKKVSRFVTKFIDALFPEISAQVRFQQAPYYADQIITDFSLDR